MGEYISKKCVYDIIYKHQQGLQNMGAILMLDTIDKEVQKASAADVQPVKHGRWLQHGKPDDYFWCCSACKKWIIFAEHDLHKHHFCGNCGARMDGDTNG